jgi:glycosyltransferase involved in cell wall biosynthesis
MSRPRVSVIVDTFNHESYIAKALDSVMSQVGDFSPDEVEVLVVDDGSSDKTPEILESYSAKVRILRKANGGQASAFNAAIAATTGEIVAFLDGDDWWETGKLRAVVRAFDENPTIAAVGHGFYEVMEDAPPREMFVPDQTRILDLSSIEAARIADLGRTLLGTSRLAVRRHVLDQLGNIPEKLVFCADTPILTIALAMGGALVLDKPLCFYRIHGSSLFSVTHHDPRKLRARAEIQRFLLEYLSGRLAEMGVQAEIIDALFNLDRLGLKRTDIWLGEGGGRRDAAAIEMEELRKTHQVVGSRYVLFKRAAAAIAFALGPERYLGLRDWYWRNNLRRFRDKLAPTQAPAEERMFQRRPVPGADAPGALNG